MNEFGILEVVTDDLECTETLNSSSEVDNMETDVKDVAEDKDEDSKDAEDTGT